MIKFINHVSGKYWRSFKILLQIAMWHTLMYVYMYVSPRESHPHARLPLCSDGVLFNRCVKQFPVCECVFSRKLFYVHLLVSITANQQADIIN